MSLHDAYARLTPFEVAFPDQEALRELLAAVTAEATERGLDVTDLESFMRLTAGGDFVRGLRAADAPPETLVPFSALLFHALHFLRADRPLFLLDTEAVRRLVADAPGGAPEPPAPAGYLQLPQHLVWMGGGEGGQPESLDGLFWTVSEGGRLLVLAITGLRPDRPGFGTVALPEAPLADAASWLDAPVRREGDDFATTLPGGELDALIGVEVAGELLKLLARFFAHVSAAEATPTVPRVPQRAPGNGTPEGPRASALPYARVTLAQ
ncbi:MAG: hypothetical protein WEB90_02480 [Gemmatimonadota bacterium]